MALIDFKVLPGIDKQDTESGAENRCLCINSRLRSGALEATAGCSDSMATSNAASGSASASLLSLSISSACQRVNMGN